MCVTVLAKASQLSLEVGKWEKVVVLGMEEDEVTRGLCDFVFLT